MFKFLNKTLSAKENVKLVENKQIVKNFDLLQFNNDFNDLNNKENTDILLNYIKDIFKNHFLPFEKLNDKQLSDKITDILFINETMFKVYKIVNESIIQDQFKDPFFKYLQEIKNKLNNYIKQIKDYRETQGKINDFQNSEGISIAVMDIYQKIFLMISEEPNIVFENFDSIFTNLILHFQEKLNNYDSDKVLKQVLQDKTIILRSEHPSKIIYSFERDLSSESYYSYINSIDKMFIFFHDLHEKINNLQNFKRKQGELFSRKKQPTPLFPKEEWKNIKNKLHNIIDENAKKFINVILRNIQKLIEYKQTQNEEFSNFFDNSILKYSDKTFHYVYDIVSLITLHYRETKINYPKSVIAETMKYLYDGILEQLIPNFNDKNISAQFLMALIYYNNLEEIEDKYHFELIEQKIKLMNYLYKLKTTSENVYIQTSHLSNQNIESIKQLLVLVEKGEIQNKNYNEVIIHDTSKDLKGYVLDDILNDLKSTVSFGRDTRDKNIQIDELFNNYIPKSPLQVLVKTVLNYYRIKNPNTEPGLYRKYFMKGYIPLIILFFSDFENIHGSLYNLFDKQFENATAFSLDEWMDKTKDQGEFFKQYIKFFILMINNNIMGFNPETGKIEYITDALNKLSDFINENKQNANVALLKLMEMNDIKPEENKNLICEHTTIEEEIKDIQEKLFLDKDNVELLNILEDLQTKLNICSIETSGTSVCKFCGLVLEQQYSYAPETFELSEELNLNRMMIDFTTLKIMQIEAEENENKLLINNYINVILKNYNIQKKDIISNLSLTEGEFITNDIITEISENILNIITNRMYLKSYTKQFKTSYTIHNKQRTDQINHDLIKFLVIFKLRNYIKNTENLKISEHLQLTFSNIQSLKNYIPMTAYDLYTRLNYNRIIYNISVKLYNNSFIDTLPEDNLEIKNFEDSGKITQLIITQNFNFKEKSLDKFDKILKNVEINTEKKDYIKLVDNLNNKFVDKYTNKILKYQLNYTKKLKIIDHLSRFIKFEQSSTQISKFIYSEQLKRLPIDYSNQDFNFVSLYLHFMYKSSLQINNKYYDEYTQKYSNIDILEGLKIFDKLCTNSSVLNYLEKLYLHRKAFIINYIENMTLMKFIYDYSKTGKISNDKEFSKSIKFFLDLNFIEYPVIIDLLKSSNFQSFINSTIVPFFEEQNGNEILTQYKTELLEYKKTIEVLFNSNKKIVNICPFDEKLFKNPLILKIHLQDKHKIISNDKLNIIEPYNAIVEMGTNILPIKQDIKCPYCPKQDSNKINVYYIHIKDCHINTIKSLEAFNNSLQEQYKMYLEMLYNKYMLLNGTFTERSYNLNLQLNIEEAQVLDEKYNNLKIIETFCFKNNKSFNLYKHHYINNKCVICNLTRTQIKHLIEDEELVENFIISVIERYSEILNRYDFSSQRNLFRENIKNKITSPTGDKLLMNDTFLPNQNKWEILRKNIKIPFNVLLNIANETEKYINIFYAPQKDGDYVENFSLDLIDELSDIYFSNKKIPVLDFHFHENYLQNISKSYSNKLKHLIINKKNKELEQETTKLIKEDKRKNYKKIISNIRKINENIKNDAKEYILMEATGSSKSLLKDVSLYTQNSLDNFINNVNNIEKYDSKLFIQRKDLIKLDLKNFFVCLKNMNENNKLFYKSKYSIYLEKEVEKEHLHTKK